MFKAIRCQRKVTKLIIWSQANSNNLRWIRISKVGRWIKDKQLDQRSKFLYRNKLTNKGLKQMLLNRILLKKIVSKKKKPQTPKKQNKSAVSLRKKLMSSRKIVPKKEIFRGKKKKQLNERQFTVSSRNYLINSSEMKAISTILTVMISCGNQKGNRKTKMIIRTVSIVAMP